MTQAQARTVTVWQAPRNYRFGTIYVSVLLVALSAYLLVMYQYYALLGVALVLGAVGRVWWMVVRPRMVAGPDGVDVWASTQYPEGARAIAAEAAGVGVERVRVHPQWIGGGFGRRLDVDFVRQAVAIARAVPGRPVKLIWTREDDVRHDFYRPPSLHRLRGAARLPP